MRGMWLKQNGHKSLILFFAGWQIGSETIAHLQGEYDVLFVDLLDDAHETLPELTAYETVNAVAFSFGVAAFAHWQGRPDIAFDKSIAINGTLAPVDRSFGIPPIVMQKTIDSLSAESFQAFLVRCFGAAQPLQEINVERARAQLETVQAWEELPVAHFDAAWVSTKDKIFPPQNQKRFWEKASVAAHEIDAAHVPFAQWQSWDEVLNVR
jgi:biotin synthesis protein BioG